MEKLQFLIQNGIDIQLIENLTEQQLILFNQQVNKIVDKISQEQLKRYTTLYQENNVRNPIIGILAQPHAYQKENQYIAASYVKYLEACGARVCPIKFDSKQSDLEQLVENLNGILFTGGKTKIVQNQEFTQYSQTAQFLYNLVIKKNNEGNYFPLWATCLGFEQVVLFQSGEKLQLDKFSNKNVLNNLQLINQEKSVIFKDLSFTMIELMCNKKLIHYSHVHGIEVHRFRENKKLDEFFNITSIAQDINQKIFVNCIEAKEYPIFCVQFHPEKNGFEWNENVQVNNSSEAIMIRNFFGEFFGNLISIFNEFLQIVNQ